MSRASFNANNKSITGRLQFSDYNSLSLHFNGYFPGGQNAQNSSYKFEEPLDYFPRTFNDHVDFQALSMP